MSKTLELSQGVCVLLCVCVCDCLCVCAPLQPRLSQPLCLLLCFTLLYFWYSFFSLFFFYCHRVLTSFSRLAFLWRVAPLPHLLFYNHSCFSLSVFSFHSSALCVYCRCGVIFLAKSEELLGGSHSWFYCLFWFTCLIISSHVAHGGYFPRTTAP